MKITRFNTAENFLEQNQEFLEKEEAINSLMLGLALANRKKKDDNTLYLNIVDEDEILFSAIKTEGRELIIYGNDQNQKDYIAVLIRYLQKDNIDIPGINGPKEIVLQLGELICKEFNWKYEIRFRQMVYILNEVKYNPKVEGELKKGDVDDLVKISNWLNLFYKEAFNKDDEKAINEIAKNKIINGESYIWMDKLEVTISCTARPTKNGITINYVYTPIEYRRKGYGTKIVSHLSKLMLEEGYKFCTLFTDLDNPTSNSIYKKIGYEPIQEFRTIKFEKNTST